MAKFFFWRRSLLLLGVEELTHPLPPPASPLPSCPAAPQDLNPGAVQRLLAQTEATKTRFLDRKFLRRQKLGGGLRASRMWYVDLDTWMASTTGGGAAAAAQTQQKQQQEVRSGRGLLPRRYALQQAVQVGGMKRSF